MAEFAVRLEGRCLLRKLERHWLILYREGRQPAGFFTTRWVEAPNADEATATALRLVDQELATWPGGQVIADPAQSPQIWAEAVWEDGAGLAQHPTGGEGFTFFALNDEARSRAHEAEVGNASP